jgi:Domain of unknown function (DUF4387)
MPRLKDVCRYMRSKNAGPFWVTVDLFFDDAGDYARYCNHPAIGREAVAKLYGVEPELVKRFTVDSLKVVKISYPRQQPQGGTVERDMHGGQQFVRLLDTELG